MVLSEALAATHHDDIISSATDQVRSCNNSICRRGTGRRNRGRHVEATKVIGHHLRGGTAIVRSHILQMPTEVEDILEILFGSVHATYRCTRHQSDLLSRGAFNKLCFLQGLLQGDDTHQCRTGGRFLLNTQQGLHLLIAHPHLSDRQFLVFRL